jgi:TusA-related sulfurtransferase
MKTVDARGQVCPKPLILTKQALKEVSPGEQISVLIDNPTSRQNVERFLLR